LIHFYKSCRKKNSYTTTHYTAGSFIGQISSRLVADLVLWAILA